MIVRVIGVGTQQGDDAAGLVVAQALARRALPAGTEVVCCERPLDLVRQLAGARAVLIADAVRSSARPGTLHRLAARDLRRSAGLSSHALGVVHALELAQALGRDVDGIEIVGIEVGADVDRAAQLAPDLPLSPAVSRGVDAAVDAIAQRLAGLAASAGRE